MPLAPDIRARLRKAVRQFWLVRQAQAKKQGAAKGARDAGERAAVTGGAQMDGFVNLVRDVLCEYGMERASVHCESHLELPGWYRPEKQWDLIVISDGTFLTGIEFRSGRRSVTTTTTARRRRWAAPPTCGRPIARARSSRRPGLG